MRLRRALLYVPGDDLRKINKACTLGVDCVCLDMEDGVASNRKDQARIIVAETLSTIDFQHSERLARINPVGSGLEIEDLTQALSGHPDGIVIPKVERADAIRWADEIISAYENENGWAAGGISLLAGVESAMGILNLGEIARSSDRLQGIIFGAEDLASDIGARRSREGWEVFYARSAVLTHCAAYQLQAIDMVYVDYNDPQGLLEEALQGARFGFAGKQVIHPNQVQPVQEAYTPDDNSIAKALRLVEANEAQQAEGKGAFSVDGKMVDAPVIRAAERLLEIARAAGRIDQVTR